MWSKEVKWFVQGCKLSGEKVETLNSNSSAFSIYEIVFKQKAY